MKSVLLSTILALCVLVGCSGGTGGANSAAAGSNSPSIASVCSKVTSTPTCGSQVVANCNDKLEQQLNDCPQVEVDSLLACLSNATYTCNAAGHPMTKDCLTQTAALLASCGAATASGGPGLPTVNQPSNDTKATVDPVKNPSTVTNGTCSRASDCPTYTCACPNGGTVSSRLCLNNVCPSSDIVCSLESNESLNRMCTK